MKNTKPVVDESRKTFEVEEDIDWPQGSPDDIIKLMQDLKERYTRLGWGNLYVDYYWYDYECCDYRIRGVRHETDEEMQRRIDSERRLLSEWQKEFNKQKEAKCKARKEKRRTELKELARLQAKYGKC